MWPSPSSASSTTRTARITPDSALISRTLFTTIQAELQWLPTDYQALV
jgi:hypothetical protein